MHGVPERRSNERGGWCGVTPCVVPPPHRLPTKCATFTSKYDRLLAARGCRGERHGLAKSAWMVCFLFFLFKSLMLTCRRWYSLLLLPYFYILTAKQHLENSKSPALNFRPLSKMRATDENMTTTTQHEWQSNTAAACTDDVLMVETFATISSISLRLLLQRIMPLPVSPRFLSVSLLSLSNKIKKTLKTIFFPHNE